MKKSLTLIVQSIARQLKKSSSLLDNFRSSFNRNNNLPLFFFLVLVIFFQNTLPAYWYDKKLEGWYYFEDKPATSTENPSLTPEQADALLSIESRKLKQLLSLAIISPTEENVKNYIQTQRRWISQSNLFAQAWGKTLLNYPELSDFLTTPTSSYGILAKKTDDLETRKTLLQTLSKDYFLLFFFNGADPLSQKVAEVAQLFATANAWQYKAVSVDGKGLPNLQTFEIDKGISTLFGLRVTPSLFIVNPADNQAYPVGAGLVTVSEIEQNIETQIRGTIDER